MTAPWNARPLPAPDREPYPPDGELVWELEIDLDPHEHEDPEPRRVTKAEREDRVFDLSCATCGRSLTDTEDDWDDDGDRCPTCVEIAKELDEEDDDDPPATLPTGEERTT